MARGSGNGGLEPDLFRIDMVGSRMMKTLAESPARTNPAVIEILDALGDAGYRSTRPRKQVVERVLAETRPFTAEQMVAGLPQIGRATVYRTLEILASIDVLTRLIRPGGYPAYVVGQPGHRHHLICSQCGRVVEFTACPVDPLIETLIRETNFHVESHHLEIIGLCPDCFATGPVAP